MWHHIWSGSSQRRFNESLDKRLAPPTRMQSPSHHDFSSHRVLYQHAGASPVRTPRHWWRSGEHVVFMLNSRQRPASTFQRPNPQNWFARLQSVSALLRESLKYDSAARRGWSSGLRGGRGRGGSFGRLCTSHRRMKTWKTQNKSLDSGMAKWENGFSWGGGRHKQPSKASKLRPLKGLWSINGWETALYADVGG